MRLLTTIMVFVAGSCAFGFLSTDIGIRVSNNLSQTIDQCYIIGVDQNNDTSVIVIPETTMAYYTGLGIDFHVSPFRNFDIRMTIAEARYLHAGGTEFVIFPGIGADLSYWFALGRFLPYLTFGLTFDKFRVHPTHDFRAGIGLGYAVTEKFTPYVECQIWDKTYRPVPVPDGQAYATREVTGVEKIHAGLKIKL